MATFTLADYIVLIIILIVLSAIGLYYRFTGGKQSSNEEYLLGDRNQPVLPVALSIVASHASGLSVMGSPAEVYYRGAIYCVNILGLAAVIPITAHLFLPVFYNAGSCSIYEYLERRFGRRTRTLAACLFPLQSVLFMAVVLYAPALALRTLSGLPTLWSVVIVGSTCTFYSSIGGIKAVIMTDVFQFLITISAAVAIIVTAYIKRGSLTDILEIADKGGRINFLNFDLTERHTFWSISIGLFFTYMSTFAVHQAHVQRYLTLRDYKSAVKTLYICWPISSAFIILLAFAGLSIYSLYHDCDPLARGEISSIDQLLPFFAIHALGNVPGLPGLVMAGIFSASLSSISAFLNALSAISVQDFVKPVYERCKQTPMSEAQALVSTKLISVGYGVLLMVIAYFARYVTGLIQTALSLTGLVGASMIAIFTLGLFFPPANEKGAIAALLTGVVTSSWLNFGGPRPPVINLPVSTVGCGTNITSNLNFQSQVNATHDIKFEGIFYLHRVSYLWYIVISCLLALLVGVVVSLCTPFPHKRPDPSLLSPPVAAWLRRNTQSTQNLVYFSRNKANDEMS